MPRKRRRKWRRRTGIGKGRGSSWLNNERIRKYRCCLRAPDWCPPPWYFIGYPVPSPDRYDVVATPFDRLSDDEGYSTCDSEEGQEDRRAADRRLNEDPATNFHDIPHPTMCQKAVLNDKMKKLIQNDRKNRGQNINKPLRSFEYTGETHMEACRYERIVSWLSSVQSSFVPDEDEDEEALSRHSSPENVCDMVREPDDCDWPISEPAKQSHRENQPLMHLSWSETSVKTVSYADIEFRPDLERSTNGIFNSDSSTDHSPEGVSVIRILPARNQLGSDQSLDGVCSDNRCSGNGEEGDRPRGAYRRANMVSKTKMEIGDFGMEKKEQSQCTNTNKSQFKSSKSVFSRLKNSLARKISSCLCFGGRH